MSTIRQLYQLPQVKKALSELKGQVTDTVELAITIQQIPAPTFAEKERADFMEARFTTAGLTDVWQDELFNVYGRWPGTSDAPPLVVSAHLDTVFPAETDLTIRREERNGRQLIFGPGLADNATGLAGLLTLLQTLHKYHFQFERDIWFVANSREEGLGDLDGIRAVVDRFDQATYLVLEGGSIGQIYHPAISVRRYEITAETSGGHSWGNFGDPNAIHIISHLIAAIDQLSIPTEPRTTYNVGLIEGGLSINTIAPTATMLLDLRSAEQSTLTNLVETIETLVRQANQPADVKVTMRQIGNRPAGRLARQADLVQWAAEALRLVGYRHISYLAGSNDANIPLSRGLSAICIGLANCGNTHRLNEYLDPTYLAYGLSQLLLLVMVTAQPVVTHSAKG